MLNSRYVSISGLDIFRDSFLAQFILSDNDVTAVPAGTTPSSFLTYYTRTETSSGSGKYIYSPANPQPTTAVAANTYWLLNEGSPNDTTRTASVNAITTYVENTVDTAVSDIEYNIEHVIAPEIDKKVSSVSFDNNNKKIKYTSNYPNSNTTTDVVTFAGSGATTVTASSGTLTISSTDTKNTAGATTNAQIQDALYIIGATTQTVNPQTYSSPNAKIDQSGYLYSHGDKLDMDVIATKTYVTTEIASAIGNAMAASY